MLSSWERSLEKVGGSSLGTTQPRLLYLRKRWKAFQSYDRKGSHTLLGPPGKRCLGQPGFWGLEFVSCVRQLSDRYCQPSDDSGQQSPEFIRWQNPGKSRIGPWSLKLKSLLESQRWAGLGPQGLCCPFCDAWAGLQLCLQTPR